MAGPDLIVPGAPGLLLAADDRDAGPVGEPGPVAELRHVRRAARHEPLLGRLLGDPHAPPDVGPGGAAAAGLVDEVADEVVGEVAELLADQHGVGEVGERVAVRVLGPDQGNEVVEARKGCGHTSTVS